jgi:hypothetical protein
LRVQLVDKTPNSIWLQMVLHDVGADFLASFFHFCVEFGKALRNGPILSNSLFVQGICVDSTLGRLCRHDIPIADKCDAHFSS